MMINIPYLYENMGNKTSLYNQKQIWDTKIINHKRVHVLFGGRSRRKNNNMWLLAGEYGHYDNEDHLLIQNIYL